MVSLASERHVFSDLLEKKGARCRMFDLLPRRLLGSGRFEEAEVIVELCFGGYI